MKPYYDDGQGIVIWHADCRDILPTLEPGSVDLVLTDPPYIGLKGNTVHFSLGGVADVVNTSYSVGDLWGANLDWMAEAWRVANLGMMVFCSFASVADTRFALADSQAVGLLTWYKRNSPIAVNNVPRYTTEFVWLFKKQPGLLWRAINTTMFDIPNLQAGCMAAERLTNYRGATIHPTQKPLELIKRLLAVGGDTILDPFMGSGTTLRAAKDLGRRAIGIEIEEKYCQIAAERLSQEVLPMEVS